MIWKTAWKNVWRSPVRSLVVIASVTVGIFAGVFSVAFMNGMVAQRFDSAIEEEISHIQVTGKDFRLNNDPRILIRNADSLPVVIRRMPDVEAITGRTIVTGMASTATKSSGVLITGIDPSEEKMVFRINKTIIPSTGNFFEKSSKYDYALVGQDLAKELNIIRFTVDSSLQAKLVSKEIPAEVIKKVMSLSGTRFNSEKKFESAVSSVLTGREERMYGATIKSQAWTFRENARLTLTFLDRNNNQVSALFRITGIYDITNSVFESSTIFVKREVLCRLTGLGNDDLHQIVIKLKDSGSTLPVADRIRKLFPGYDVKTWKELQPDLAMMTDYVHQIYGFFMTIILAALAFGIINTMLMAVLERTKELGMLTAIGMNRRKVFSMIMLESVFLSVTGGISGMIVGWITVVISASQGINFSKYAEGMEAIGYSAHIYPKISYSFFLLVTVLIIITGIASSVYPAYKALKLDPAEAIRTE